MNNNRRRSGTMTATTFSSYSACCQRSTLFRSSLVHYHIPELLKLFIEKRTSSTRSSDFIDNNNNNGYHHFHRHRNQDYLELNLDPEILSFTILQALIIHGFQIECDFFLYYVDQQHNQNSGITKQFKKLLPIENDQDLIEARRKYENNKKGDQQNKPSNTQRPPPLYLIIDLVDYRQLFLMSSKLIMDQQKHHLHISFKNNTNDKNSIKTENDNDGTTVSVSGEKLSKYNVLSEWDIVTSSDVILAQTFAKTNNFILNQIEKLKTKALVGLSAMGEQMPPSTSTSMITANSWLLAEAIYQYIMSDDSSQANIQQTTAGNHHTDREPISDLRPYLDQDGRVKSQRNFRVAIYRRGMDHAIRRIGWKHLLNVYPNDYTGQQRIDFIRQRSETYRQMRNLWQLNARTDPEVINVCNMVKKDVLRTDRHHSFYSGSDLEDECSDCHWIMMQHNSSSSNVVSLFNLLVTYALNHRYRYCQGMSDLASPLLYVMKDESHAYITFCALMQRVAENFAADGQAINRKFRNLKHLLQHYDPQFYDYLLKENADELLFSYRWILLDLKREFPFDDVLEMLEVLWASIPPPSTNVHPMELFDKDFLYIPNCNTKATNSVTTANSFQSNTTTTSRTVPETKNPETATEGNNVKLASTGSARPRPPKLHAIKFMPNMLSNDSTTTICDGGDSPSIFYNTNLDSSSFDRPRPWDSPILNRQKNKFEFDGSLTNETRFVKRIGSSRFYVDVPCDFLFDSAGSSSASSSSYDGDGEDTDNKNKITELTLLKPNELRSHGQDDVSSCSTFDSGIQSSSNIISELTQKNDGAKSHQKQHNSLNGNPRKPRRSLILVSSSHCNGENCTDDEDDFEKKEEKLDNSETNSISKRENISSISVDHGYLTDNICDINSVQCSNFEQIPATENTMRNRSHSATIHRNRMTSFPYTYQQPLKAQQLLDGLFSTLLAGSPTKKEISELAADNDQNHLDSLSTLEKSSSAIEMSDHLKSCHKEEDKHLLIMMNEQFNRLSAKSVSEEMLNSAIKQMETNLQQDRPTSINSVSTSSIEIIPSSLGDDDHPNEQKNPDVNRTEEFPLISPEQLGSNDAFMLFLCLTLLLQNREYIMQKQMDRNDIQMYFDAMVRKHNVHKVLHDARHLFHTYLAEWRKIEQ